MSKWDAFIQSSSHEPIDQELLSRLSRHLVLPGWGISEQKSFDGLNIVVIGCGGLGSVLGLALSGSLYRNKSLVFVDGDTVDVSNLHRQVAFDESMVGKSKAECMKEVCIRRNSTLNVTAVDEFFTSTTSGSLVDSADVVYDCTDNVHARIHISDAWVSSGRRFLLVSASCVGWSGQLVTLRPGQNGCLRCVYHGVGADACDHMGQCAISGVMTPVVSLMANFQFMELIRWIHHEREAASGRPTSVTQAPLGVNIFSFENSIPFIRGMELPAVCSSCTGISPDVDGLLQVGDDPYRAEVREIDPDVFFSMLQSRTCNIVDVRESPHYKLAHLKDSHHIPASQYLHYNRAIPGEYFRMITDPKGTTVVVCRRGIDSLRFARKFGGNCVSLKGGLLGLGIDGII
jgi:molybdopterin/thiamine biosynthesis adenylyltransferase/rhodanese-related sulfurtransferase